MRPDAKERAQAYIAKSAPRSVAGQGGDNTTHGVACTLSIDFGLDDGSVAELLGDYNRTKCDPPWDARNLERHVRSARRTANSKPNEVGKLLGVDRKDYTGPSSPPNKPTAAPTRAPTPATAAPAGHPPAPTPGAAPRTGRTPLFSVRRSGEGGLPRFSRTVRTLPIYSGTDRGEKVPVNVDWSSGGVSAVSEPSGTVSGAATNLPSEVSAPKLRALPPGAVTANRAGLVGDALRVYDALLRRGPMTRATMIAGLKWTEERFATAETKLTADGWILVNQTP